MSRPQGGLIDPDAREQRRALIRARRRQRRRVVVTLLRLLIRLGLFALNGWLFMLAVDVAHDHWIPQLPTIGYPWATLLAALLSVGFAIRVGDGDD